MPSKIILEQKQQAVADLAEKLRNSVSGVLVNYQGITVEDDTAMRKALREAGVKYTVVKNTLLSIAVDGTPLSGLTETLSGTTAIATSADDYTSAARILSKYAETSDTFSVKGGFLDGEVIGLDKIEALAKLPSREVLLATVCNVFNAPIASFARAVQAIVDKEDGSAAE